MSVVRDITERKKQENALKVSRAEADLYLDLLSHDINNINQISPGYLELAEETLKLDKDSKEFIIKPMEALQSSVSLIENVGKLRKQKNGGMKLHTIDLCDILTGLKDKYGGNSVNQVTINFNHKDACLIIANGLVTDVFSNLIINAIKHSGKPRRDQYGTT